MWLCLVWFAHRLYVCSFVAFTVENVLLQMHQFATARTIKKEEQELLKISMSTLIINNTKKSVGKIKTS